MVRVVMDQLEFRLMELFSQVISEWFGGIRYHVIERIQSHYARDALKRNIAMSEVTQGVKGCS